MKTAKTDLLITAAGAAIGAVTVAINKLRQPHARPATPAAVNYPELVVWLRQNLADACDQRNAAEAAATTFRQGIAERDAELAAAQADLSRAATAIENLLKSLNAANVRNAEMQQTLKRHGLTAEASYFLAILSDGTVAGPFSRN